MTWRASAGELHLCQGENCSTSYNCNCGAQPACQRSAYAAWRQCVCACRAWCFAACAKTGPWQPGMLLQGGQGGGAPRPVPLPLLLHRRLAGKCSGWPALGFTPAVQELPARASPTAAAQAFGQASTAWRPAAGGSWLQASAGKAVSCPAANAFGWHRAEHLPTCCCCRPGSAQPPATCALSEVPLCRPAEVRHHLPLLPPSRACAGLGGERKGELSAGRRRPPAMPQLPCGHASLSPHCFDAALIRFARARCGGCPLHMSPSSTPPWCPPAFLALRSQSSSPTTAITTQRAALSKTRESTCTRQATGAATHASSR
jgi:hypothetical protein